MASTSSNSNILPHAYDDMVPSVHPCHGPQGHQYMGGFLSLWMLILFMMPQMTFFDTYDSFTLQLFMTCYSCV